MCCFLPTAHGLYRFQFAERRRAATMTVGCLAAVATAARAAGCWLVPGVFRFYVSSMPVSCRLAKGAAFCWSWLGAGLCGSRCGGGWHLLSAAQARSRKVPSVIFIAGFASKSPCLLAIGVFIVVPFCIVGRGVSCDCGRWLLLVGVEGVVCGSLQAASVGCLPALKPC